MVRVISNFSSQSYPLTAFSLQKMIILIGFEKESGPRFIPTKETLVQVSPERSWYFLEALTQTLLKR